MPVILLQLSDNTPNRNIINLTKFGHTLIKAELQKARTTIPLCHRCQKFRHIQDKCHHSPRCVKRSQQYISYKHKKLRIIATTCANCRCLHPASFRGCRATLHAQGSSSQILSEKAHHQTGTNQIRSTSCQFLRDKFNHGCSSEVDVYFCDIRQSG